MRKRQKGSGFFSMIRRKTQEIVVYRWYQSGPDGKTRERKRVLGPAARFRSEKAAWDEVHRLGLNQRVEGAPRNLRELAEHWQKNECSADDVDPNGRRAFSTRDNYRSYLRKWVLPHWGEHTLGEVDAVEVENWLGGLKRTVRTADGELQKELADGTKKKIRDLMHILYEHAIRYKWWARDDNPISSVRQGGKRQSTPVRLTVEELSKLLYEVLRNRERVMVLFDFAAGLRRGELAGAKWGDIQFENGMFSPKRSIVKQRIGEVKTEASKKPLPLGDDLISELLAWRKQTPYAAENDYVFASPHKDGKQPYWMSRIMQYHIKPQAAKAGIVVKGWHTLRHSYTTLLRQNNNDPKVVQALVRHASIKMTLDVYDEAMSQEKQKAHRKVLHLVTRSRKKTNPYRNPYRGRNKVHANH